MTPGIVVNNMLILIGKSINQKTFYIMAKFEISEYIYYNKEKTKGCHLRISIDYEIKETPGFEPNKIKVISKSFVVSSTFKIEK